jgi:hypothetical protein
MSKMQVSFVNEAMNGLSNIGLKLKEKFFLHQVSPLTLSTFWNLHNKN